MEYAYIPVEKNTKNLLKVMKKEKSYSEFLDNLLRGKK